MRPVPLAAVLRLPTRTQAQLWLRANLPIAISAIRRRPPVVTVALIVCIAGTWIRLQVGLQLPAARFVADGFSARALIEHHYGVLATATLLSRDLFMVISLGVSLLVTMGSYEVAAGHLRALGLAVFAAAMGPTSVMAGLAILDGFGSTWAAGRMDTLDIGASAIVAASSGAVAGIVRDRRLTAGLVLFLLGGLAVHHQLADCEHLLIFPWGYLAGRVFGRARIRPSHATKGLIAAYGVAVACLLALALPASAHLLPSPRAFRSASGQVLSPPRLVQATFPSPALGQDRSVLVLLPPGYDSTRKRFPVVELLHGDPGGPAGMIALGDIERSQVASGVAPFIAVAPDGNGPVIKYSWWANTPKQAMGTSVTRDLRAWMSRSYRITDSWSYAGLSSGGFGAAYLPLIDPHPVHGVCGLSGFYTGNIPPIPATNKAARAAASPIAHTNRVPSTTFIAYGTSDKRSAAQSRAYIAALRRTPTMLVVKTYPGAHTWTVWKHAFLDCFRTIEPAN